MSKEIRKIKSGPLYRSAAFELTSTDDSIEAFIDKETRTVTLSFSSTEPVEREFGLEILDHSGDAVDLSRLNEAGPVFVNHDRNDLVGVVESASNDGARCSAVVRFGKSDRAEEIFNDVIDGIRRTVSFGYRHNKVTQLATNNNEDIPTHLVKRWQPFEISLETIPADYTVGVGRSEEEENEVIIEEEREMVETTDIPEVKIVKERDMPDKTYEDGIKAATKRLNGIAKAADAVRHLYPEVDALAEEYKNNSERTLDEFNAAVVAKMNEVRQEAISQNNIVTSADLGVSENERGRYSLSRAVNALISGKHEGAELEMEMSRTYADHVGVDSAGIHVPLDILARADADPTAKVTPNTVGSALVPVEYWGEQYIDYLRAKSVAVAMGAQVIPGLTADIDIPKGLNDATVGWLAENAANDASLYSASTVELRPQDIGAGLSYTRRMRQQAGSPGIDMLLHNALNSSITTYLDKQILVGTQTGASGLTSVANTINAVTGVTWDSITDLEAAVATANADTGALGYVTSPAVRGYMKQKVKDSSGAGGFLMNEDGLLNGYKTMMTSHAGTNLIYGNWSDILIPMWGGLEITVDTATLAAKNGVVLRGWLTTDIAVKNAESFAVQTTIAG